MPLSASAPRPPGPRAFSCSGWRLPTGYVVALFASVLFGMAIVPHNGAYDSNALALVLSGVLTLALLVGHQCQKRTTTTNPSEVVVILSVVWVVLVGMTWAARNDIWLLVSVRDPWNLARPEQTFMLLLLCAYVPALIAPQISERVLWRHLRFGLFACALLVASVDVLHTSPLPAIDVWDLQQAGADALVHGANPYTVVSVGDTGVRYGTAVPYTYPPMQLYATLPAFVLTGDVRYAMVVAILLTGVALRGISMRAAELPSLAQDAPALVVWLSPKLFLITEQAWVDPIGLALVSLAVWAHLARRPALAALLFGSAFGSKQTMVWLVPLVGVLLRFSWRQWLLALGTTIATVLPFALWDWRSLYRSTVTFLQDLPPRSDALTFSNWYHLYGGPVPTSSPGLLAAAVVVVWALWRAPRSARSLAAVAPLTYAIFFALNKIAFANYYFFVLGLAALAAAVALAESAPTSLLDPAGDLHLGGQSLPQRTFPPDESNGRS